MSISYLLFEKKCINKMDTSFSHYFCFHNKSLLFYTIESTKLNTFVQQKNMIFREIMTLSTLVWSKL